MSDYTKITDYLAKDALASGVPEKLVLGAELDAEFNAIAAAIATKTDGDGAVSVGDKGDIVVSSNGTVWTIDTNAVTVAKMQQVATATLLGRYSASTGNVQTFALGDLTEDTSPDSDVDLMMTYDTSATAFKKVKMKNLSVGIPQNAQTVNYELVMADNGRHVYHASGAGAGDTYTIPANSSVAFPIGACVTFVNMAADAVSIAITTDTLYLAGTGTTGTRTLAQYGVATAIKLTSTTWIISGTNLT